MPLEELVFGTKTRPLSVTSALADPVLDSLGWKLEMGGGGGGAVLREK